jgi:hypothetical protein
VRTDLARTDAQLDDLCNEDADVSGNVGAFFDDGGGGGGGGGEDDADNDVDDDGISSRSRGQNAGNDAPRGAVSSPSMVIAAPPIARRVSAVRTRRSEAAAPAAQGSKRRRLSQPDVAIVATTLSTAVVKAKTVAVSSGSPLLAKATVDAEVLARDFSGNVHANSYRGLKGIVAATIALPTRSAASIVSPLATTQIFHVCSPDPLHWPIAALIAGAARQIVGVKAMYACVSAIKKQDAVTHAQNLIEAVFVSPAQARHIVIIHVSEQIKPDDNIVRQIYNYARMRLRVNTILVIGSSFPSGDATTGQVVHVPPFDFWRDVSSCLASLALCAASKDTRLRVHLERVRAAIRAFALSPDYALAASVPSQALELCVKQMFAAAATTSAPTTTTKTTTSSPDVVSEAIDSMLKHLPVPSSIWVASRDACCKFALKYFGVERSGEKSCDVAIAAHEALANFLRVNVFLINGEIHVHQNAEAFIFLTNGPGSVGTAEQRSIRGSVHILVTPETTMTVGRWIAQSDTHGLWSNSRPIKEGVHVSTYCAAKRAAIKEYNLC